MNARLQQFISAEGISQSQLAELLGVGRANISHIMSGRNKPSYEFLTGLMKKFPTLNIEWILTGKGKMYKTAASAPLSALDSSPGETITLFEEEEKEELAQESDISQATADKDANIKIPEGQNSSSSSPKASDNQRYITKILVFYSDNTFEEIH